MLRIKISDEVFDEKSQEFIETNVKFVEFEHSLFSLSKWESKYEKPFLSKDSKTDEEFLDYVRFMCLTEDIDQTFLDSVINSHYQLISDYVSAKQSATWFNDREKAKPSSEQITSELIYYWMVALQIPFECQYWHLNRLMNLIKIANIKNAPPKKMSRAEAMAQQRKLNAERRAKYNTKG